MEEIWKKHSKIKNYSFSNFGQFKNITTGQILKQSVYNGHVVTFLKVGEIRRRVRISRMVAELFVLNDDPIKNNIVIHKDGNTLNNHYTNLKWGTIKEVIDTGFKDGKRAKRKHSVPVEIIRDIRKSFSETEITTKELAIKYNMKRKFIYNIIVYREAISVDPDKPYRVNKLSGEELKSFWLKKKERLEHILKLERLTIPKDELDKLLYEYVNKQKSVKKLAKEYGFPKETIKHYINNTKLPSVSLYEDEITKQLSDKVQISNYGKIIINGLLSNQKRITINGKAKGARHLVAESFVEKTDQFNSKIISLDGNIKNIKWTNLQWITPNNAHTIKIDGVNTPMVLWNDSVIPITEEIKQHIIQEYLNSTEFIDFMKKYSLSQIVVFSILRPYFEIKREGSYFCEVCGNSDERFFYKKRRNICSGCICDGKKVNNDRVENKKTAGLYRTDYYHKNAFKVKLNGAKTRSRQKNLDYDIDGEFIKDLFNKQNGRCAYTNQLISLERNDTIEFFSIDRIDSKRGYTKDNVVLVTQLVNRMKLDLSVDSFLETIKIIYEHNFK